LGGERREPVQQQLVSVNLSLLMASADKKNGERHFRLGRKENSAESYLFWWVGRRIRMAPLFADWAKEEEGRSLKKVRIYGTLLLH
jgi:hypothetical protein